MAETAADFFLKFHDGSLHEIIVVSSLHINSDELGQSGDASEDEQDLALVESLVSDGTIPVLSYREQFGDDYEPEHRNAEIKAIWTEFKLSRASDYKSAEFRKLLVARLLVYGLHGHCFLVFEKLGLAYYPSDDMGFGVVALRDAADFSAAHKFLRQAGNLEDYFSVIKR